ncbi:MAG: FKBP-type peptidyl-prolyl cis-trans isomerase [Bacteroidales bacterium]|nr:FKBP-type peptidyl-prolyl cis-trans isomerase [Bacteroidales bacterium]
MNKTKLIILFAFVFFAVSALSCKQGNAPKEAVDSEKLKESLIKANIIISQVEEEQINDFIERYGWEMQTTGSGLRYMIYEPGIGGKAEKGRVATINYTLRSISGDIIYTSDIGVPLEFEIGNGNVENGLEEAILLMQVGDKAKIILPSHLGFGLAGDDHKIQPKATLIYDIEFLAIN